MRRTANRSDMADLTHPLMPGIRCPDINSPDWARALHDKHITGFSPLVCGMRDAPEVWRTVEAGGELGALDVVRTTGGETRLLVNDGRLRLAALDGSVLWTANKAGKLVFFGDLRGNGHDHLLLAHGNRLTVLDGVTGQPVWSHAYDPPYLHLRVEVADVLPERPGLEAAVFPQYSDEGWLVTFPPDREPEIVWRKTVTVPGEHPERADHGCDIKFDLSVPDEPILWNVRHHRCRGFDARTGETVSSLVYEIGGGQRRNYGPWAFASGRDGARFIIVVGEMIQTHVHGVRLNRRGPSELAWQNYYGEVYQVPGVVVKLVCVADVDNDGASEVVYNVRDPERDFRSFVRVRDAGTGEVRAELPDSWCVGHAEGAGTEGIHVLVVHPAPNGRTPEQGGLDLYRFDGRAGPRRVRSLSNARRWGVLTIPGERGNDLLLRQTDDDGRAVLVRLDGTTLAERERTEATALVESPVEAVTARSDGTALYFVAGRRGTLRAVTWEGEQHWELPLVGGAPPTLSAADLDGDGKAELVAATAGNRVRVFHFDDDAPVETLNEEFYARRGRLGPILYDVEGTGERCLVAPGTTPDGRLTVRTFRPDGSLVWETVLDAVTDDGGMAVAWNAGEFLAGNRPGDAPRAAVALSVINRTRTLEGTYLFDGRTGRVRWFKGMYHDGEAIRGMIPCGVPSVFDWDADGVEEIVMDMYSYLAILRGNGGFAFVRWTPNIRQENSLYAALLYNSYVPVYRNPTDERPYWFVPLGHGAFGLMNPEPTDGVWREELGYDVPERVGMIDVDGDGVMEVGYAVRDSRTFICRNLWTGETEWELELPEPLDAPVITCDVDGDGKGEFLTGQYCIGTDEDGKGELRWASPVPLGWAIIADFDGDGRGEIAVPGRGGITILKGRR